MTPSNQVKSLLLSISVLLSGSAGAQLMLAAATPIVSRIYDAKSIGELGLFLAMSSILGTISSLGYAHAVSLPRQSTTALYLSLGGFISSLIIMIVAFLLFPLASLLKGEYYPAFFMYKYYWLLVFSIPLYGLLDISRQLTLRSGGYGAASYASVIQAGTTVAIQVVAGFIAPSSVTLIASRVSGQVAFIAFLFNSLGRHRNTIRKKFRLRRLTRVLTTYIRYPLFRASQDLLFACAESLPILMLASHYGAVTAGQYAMARILVTAPASLVIASAGQAIFQHIARERDYKVRYRLATKTTLLFAGLSAPGAVFSYCLLRPVVELILGPGWEDASHMCAWLALLALASFVATPLQKAFSALGKQATLFSFTVATSIGRLLALYVAFSGGAEAVEAIIIFSLAGVASYIIQTIYMWIKFPLKSVPSLRSFMAK